MTKQNHQGVWSEEEMREIPADPPARSGRGLAQRLRTEVIERNNGSSRPHELTRGRHLPSVIFSGEAGDHGNFVQASYRRILSRPEWALRLEKVHTAKRQARRTGPEEEIRTWRELDAATSSDGLLMNVFCYPGVLGRGKAGDRLRALLGVATNEGMQFGYRTSAPLQRGLVDRTEVDLRVEDLLIEAKLTEADFQFAAMRLIERYIDFEAVFDQELLPVTRRGVRSYQLIRGVLAAHAEGARFCVLCDRRRPDLIEDWFAVVGAVRSAGMRSRLQLVTWQEIAAVVPRTLQRFLEEKYGILAHDTVRGSR